MDFIVYLVISSVFEQKANGTLDFRSEELLRSLSRGDLLNSFHSLGDQVSYLWNTFLKFHRLDILHIITIVYRLCLIFLNSISKAHSNSLIRHCC